MNKDDRRGWIVIISVVTFAVLLLAFMIIVGSGNY